LHTERAEALAQVAAVPGVQIHGVHTPAPRHAVLAPQALDV